MRHACRSLAGRRIVLNCAGALLALTGCGSDRTIIPPGPPGTIVVHAATTGPDADANGYLVAIDSGPAQTLGANGSTTFDEVPSGEHTLDVGGVSGNCTVADGATRQVDVLPDDSTDIALQVACVLRRIAYQGIVGDKVDIYTVNSDGSGAERLTTGSRFDGFPAWSRDGSRIAFTSERDDNLELYVMAADGGAVQRLTNDPRPDQSPAWSPDGRRIAFVSGRAGGDSVEIYVMELDGSEVTRLTSASAQESTPSWSPDGSRIIFTSMRDGRRQIYVMNADGTGQHRVTESSGNDGLARFSPDGSRIVFQSDRDGDNEIYVMNADGAGVTQLTRNSVFKDEAPDWSSDGSRIVFHSDRDGRWAIYTMKPDDGSEVTRVTTEPSDAKFPAWLP
jgi:Tol biopolymer transport system component